MTENHELQEEQTNEQESSTSQHPQPPETSATTNESPDFGWSPYAEKVNGRFAMIGFLAVLLIEVLSKDIFIHWAGIIN